jgi:uncharacterized protein YkwD
MLRRTRVVAFCLAFSAAPAAPPVAGAEPAPARALIERLNVQRQRQGKPPLRHSPVLSASAARFSKRQMRLDRFGHDARIRASGRFRHLGEILAVQQGWQLRAGPIVRSWLGSAVHRSLITSSRFDCAGVGWSKGRLGGRVTTIWTVQFGGG